MNITLPVRTTGSIARSLRSAVEPNLCRSASPRSLRRGPAPRNFSLTPRCQAYKTVEEAKAHQRMGVSFEDPGLLLPFHPPRHLNLTKHRRLTRNHCSHSQYTLACSSSSVVVACIGTSSRRKHDCSGRESEMLLRVTGSPGLVEILR